MSSNQKAENEVCSNMAEQLVNTGDRLVVRAPAKINLSLLVAGKRDDGYHDIETVMAKVDLYDELYFSPGEKGVIELVCEGEYPAPEGEENLVYQACSLLCERVGVEPGFNIRLVKHIPAGAGLGGGSSDAAAALVGLNEFAGLGIGKDKLSEMAAELGSDVCFFLGGPLAFCRGHPGKKRIGSLPNNRIAADNGVVRPASYLSSRR